MITNLSCDDVLHNWTLIEKWLVSNYYSPYGETCYEDIARRIGNWLTTSETLDKVESNLQPVFGFTEEKIQLLLLTRKVVPSTAILKYGGVDSIDNYKNYFSYSILPDYESFFNIGLKKAVSGQEMTFRPTIDDEEKIGKINSLTREMFSNDYASLIFQEDGLLVENYIKLRGKETERTLASIGALSHLKEISQSISKEKTFNLIFSDNIKRKSIFFDTIPSYSTAKLPGYIGPQGTACPMFYLNLSTIINSVDSYPEYLKEVNDAAYFSALMANLVLFQETGYPIPKLREGNKKYRPIGVGVMGLHAALMRCDIPYNSDAAISFAAQTQACLTLGAMSASALLMNHATKKDRIGQNIDALKDQMEECQEVILDEEVRLKDVLPIYEALKNHGCIYNLTTTVQGYDPGLSKLVGVSTEGIEPLFSVETRTIIDESQIQLVPIELYDETGIISTDINVLNEDTFFYTSPEHKLNLINTIQKYSHSGVASYITLPKNYTPKVISKFIEDAHKSGVFSINLSKKDFILAEKTGTEEIPVLEYKEIENIEVTEENNSGPSVVPSPYDGEQSIMSDDDSEIEILDAKIFRISSPNLELRVVISNDGSCVMVDAPSDSDNETSIYISKGLNQLTISGQVNDGNITASNQY